VNPGDFLEYTTNLAMRLERMKKKAVFVGLPNEKVGGKVYGNGMSIFRIGATHEYGATFTHPGGTRYTIGGGGKARLVSNSFNGPVAGITKPHTISIPQRSFLRVPFATKRKEMNAVTTKQFVAVVKGLKVDAALGRMGVAATNISKGAFTTQGYGAWPGISADTARRKGSTQTMIDKGILRSSITWVIRKA